MGTIPPNSLKEKFEDAVKHCGSSLSSNVQKLICESFVLPNDDITHKISNKEFDFTTSKFELLDESLWLEIESVLGGEILKANYLEINYLEAVGRLCPLCHAIHKEIIHLEQLEFEEQFIERLQWTGCSERFIKCLSLLKSSNPADHILCLLLLTSSLEHALGDVYLSFSGSAHCPSLLKDLLATSELKDVFGETVMRLLYILIGPPSSLNLRNVLWHGFVAPGEVPVQYASFLLVITASMYCKLENEPFCSRKIRRRPLRKLSVDAGMQLNVFPLIKISDMPEVLELFHANFFIIPNMLPLWLQAVDYFVQKRFDFCMVLLLPQLEHGLRRLFACVNNSPQRVMTAESTVLYTTFDEILSPVLPDGSENLLRQEIGDEYLEMLLDVLVHSEGPRIRDHISHGEVDLSEISQDLANHILCICIAFLGLYNFPDKNSHGCRHQSVPGQICDAGRQYKSLFHPVSLLTMSVHNAALSLLNWHNLPKPSEEEFKNPTGSQCDEKWIDRFGATMEALCQWMESILAEHGHKLLPCKFGVDNVSVFVEVVEEILNIGKFTTLYRPKDEIAITALLRSIIQHISVISEQVCEAAKVKYDQWVKRQLRQRQRTNFKRLWLQIPSFFLILQSMVCVVIVEQFKLSKDTYCQDRSTLIRFLKRCLQCSENMNSLSSISKNRWDECSTVGKTWLQFVEMRYTGL